MSEPLARQDNAVVRRPSFLYSALEDSIELGFGEDQGKYITHWYSFSGRSRWNIRALLSNRVISLSCPPKRLDALEYCGNGQAMWRGTTTMPSRRIVQRKVVTTTRGIAIEGNVVDLRGWWLIGEGRTKR